MTRYYFNIVGKSEMVSDLEGSELPTLEDARREAISDARLLMSEAVKLGHDISSRRIEICDSAGEVLLSVPFSSVVTQED